MLCKSCGAQIADGSIFCTVCGVKQNPEEATQPESEASQEQVLNNEIPQVQPVNNGMPQGQPMNNGMPPQGQWNNGMPQGQPMNNGMPPQGQWNNGMPQGQPMYNGMPQAPMNGMGYIPAAPKKPFVMPMAVNIIFGILAVAAAAAFVCVLIFGAPRADLTDGANGTEAAEVTLNPLSEQTENDSFDVSSYSFDLEVPESDEAANAAALADNYVFYDSDSRYLEETELDELSEDDLVIAYYEIWARAGLDFSTVSGAEDINQYFLEKTWYAPWFSYEDIHFEYHDAVLNEYEAANEALINEYITMHYPSEEEAVEGGGLDQFVEEE